MFKVGQRVWVKSLKKFDVIKRVLGKRYELTDEALFVVSEAELHETADDMFEKLGWIDKSYTTKGWYLIERDFGKFIDEIRIDILTSDYQKSRVFPVNKMMWSAKFTKEEHLAIHQKGIELGWWE